MKSNYKPIGEYIRQIKIKNTDGVDKQLLGINIDKYFMPSVANVVGTDLTKYKIVKKKQFACNRMHVGRDKRLPVAFSDKEEDFIVSPAYDVFEIIDKDVLLPEYLRMWFSRKEFDRNAWFYTDADVRGGLHWDAFCNIKLPVPSIEKQREIVKEYNTVVNRIKLNEALNKKLEETAQAIYKQWFVDFEFPFDFAQGKPDKNGKPYKSSGGKMVWNEELGKEIPEGWRVGSLEDIAEIIDGDRGVNYPKQCDFYLKEFCLFLNAGNVTNIGFNFTTTSFITKEKDLLLRKGKLKRQDIVLTTRGTVGNVAFYSNSIKYNNIRINSGMIIFRAKENIKSLYIYSMMKSLYMNKNIGNYTSGSAQPQLPIKDIKRMPTLIPDSSTIDYFSLKYQPIQSNLDIHNKESSSLLKIKNLLLSRMTKT